MLISNLKTLIKVISARAMLRSTGGAEEVHSHSHSHFRFHFYFHFLSLALRSSIKQTVLETFGGIHQSKSGGLQTRDWLNLLKYSSFGRQLGVQLCVNIARRPARDATCCSRLTPRALGVVCPKSRKNGCKQQCDRSIDRLALSTMTISRRPAPATCYTCSQTNSAREASKQWIIAAYRQ